MYADSIRKSTLQFSRAFKTFIGLPHISWLVRIRIKHNKFVGVTEYVKTGEYANGSHPSHRRKLIQHSKQSQIRTRTTGLVILCYCQRRFDHATTIQLNFYHLVSAHLYHLCPKTLAITCDNSGYISIYPTRS